MWFFQKLYKKYTLFSLLSLSCQTWFYITVLFKEKSQTFITDIYYPNFTSFPNPNQYRSECPFNRHHLAQQRFYETRLQAKNQRQSRIKLLSRSNISRYVYNSAKEKVNSPFSVYKALLPLLLYCYFFEGSMSLWDVHKIFWLFSRILFYIFDCFFFFH